MRPSPATQLNSRQKAAILLVALGPEASAKIYKHLREDEIENMTLEVARMGKIAPEARRQVVHDFHEMCIAQEVISEGGIDQARKALEAAFGAERANEVVNRVTQALQVLPFDFIKKTDPTQLLSFIQDEHPQTIALILAHLDSKQAAAVVSGLPQELRAEVARRIAIMDRTPPEVIREIERVLERKLSGAVVTQAFTAAGGVKSPGGSAELCRPHNRKDYSGKPVGDQSRIGRRSEKTDVRVRGHHASRRRLHSEGLARSGQQGTGPGLKGVGEEVQSRIFKNMSERAATMLKEDMEFMGPVRLRNVEEAQQRIVGVIRRLEENGEIVVARGGGGGGDEIII